MNTNLNSIVDVKWFSMNQKDAAWVTVIIDRVFFGHRCFWHIVIYWLSLRRLWAFSILVRMLSLSFPTAMLKVLCFSMNPTLKVSHLGYTLLMLFPVLWTLVLMTEFIQRCQMRCLSATVSNCFFSYFGCSAECLFASWRLSLIYGQMFIYFFLDLHLRSHGQNS